MKTNGTIELQSGITYNELINITLRDGYNNIIMMSTRTKKDIDFIMITYYKREEYYTVSINSYTYFVTSIVCDEGLENLGLKIARFEND